MCRAEMDSDNEGVRVGGRCINNLRYADDTTLIAESLNGLKNLISTIKNKSAESEHQENKNYDYGCSDRF